MDPESVVVGNGSNEVLELLFKALVEPGDEVVFSDPSFLLYEKFSVIFGAETKKVPLKDFTHDLPSILEKISPRTRLVFLDSPHNPTGSVLKRKEFVEFLEKVPEGVVVVVDEAYGEFVRDEEAVRAVDLLKEGYPVVVVRTFSKAYGLAGLRVGYGLCEPSLARILNAVRQPFNVNLLAQVAAREALLDREHLKKSVELVWSGLDYFYEELPRLGLRPVPSQANFLLVDCGTPARPLYEALLRRGVIVRSMEAYGFPDFLRISVGMPEENRALVEALRELLR